MSYILSLQTLRILYNLQEQFLNCEQKLNKGKYKTWKLITLDPE